MLLFSKISSSITNTDNIYNHDINIAVVNIDSNNNQTNEKDEKYEWPKEKKNK